MADPSSNRSDRSEDAHVAGRPALNRSCRVCGKSVKTTEATFPFCSDRCRLVDLGKWFNESYRVTRRIDEVDEVD